MAIYIESKIGQPIRSIRPGDAGFMLQGIVTATPRAYIEISKDCPYSFVDIIDRAYQQGWIKAVANVPDNELMWQQLGE